MKFTKEGNEWFSECRDFKIETTLHGRILFHRHYMSKKKNDALIKRADRIRSAVDLQGPLPDEFSVEGV